MNVSDVPVVGTVLDSGADDRVFDSLLLAGPLVIVTIGVLGRSILTELLAVGYVTLFVGYVCYRGIDRRQD
ncbi:MAG: hypothetical protein ABEI98_09115 [Halorhabdus sp.]